MNRPFNPKLLTLARQVKRFSQVDLVERLAGLVTQGTLSKIEHGLMQPSGEIVERISNELGFRTSFFYDDAYVSQPVVSYHRKRQKLSMRDVDSVHAMAELFRINLRKCLESVEIETSLLPVPAIDPDMYPDDIPGIARAVRQTWNLPRGPIDDLTKVIEDAGVLVISFDFGSPLIDGFCQFAGNGTPACVFMNNQQPKDRYRFSLAHELGHLVMHQTPNPHQEDQANQFASEFLMPTSEIKSDFEDLSMFRFMDLKRYWGVSMQALMYKAWYIGKLSDRMYKYYNIEMSKRGWRKSEPVEATHLVEEPSTFKSVILAHLEDLGFSIEELCDLFGLRQDFFFDHYPIAKPKPKLRLVRS